MKSTDDDFLPTAVLVTNRESGRIVKVKPGQVWRDFFDTVAQFDDMTKEEQAKHCCDTLVKDPGFWLVWFNQHIAGDWDYIRSIGKEVRKPSRKCLRQAIGHLEYHAQLSTTVRFQRV